MIDDETVRTFFRRLGHGPYGLTELVALDKESGRMRATGFFDDEELFIRACRAYTRQCNLYAGRNPRQRDICQVANVMDTLCRKRAKDEDIAFVTAMSLDIDPVRRKGEPANREQRKSALLFANNLRWDLGGGIDDSGNGVYLWFSFTTPIRIDLDNATRIKQQCRLWQERLKEKYRPEKYGLRIDGCYDFSRIKRVIGTFNHKARRLSRQVKASRANDMIRDEILTLNVSCNPKRQKKLDGILVNLRFEALPMMFRKQLESDLHLRALWFTPPVDGDRSKHDWKLGLHCLEVGINDPQDLALILMHNPFGKYRRDQRDEYIQVTVRKLMLPNCNHSDFWK